MKYRISVFFLMSFLISFGRYFFVQIGQDPKEEKKQQMREFFDGLPNNTILRNTKLKMRNFRLAQW